LTEFSNDIEKWEMSLECFKNSIPYLENTYIEYYLYKVCDCKGKFSRLKTFLTHNIFEINRLNRQQFENQI